MPIQYELQIKPDLPGEVRTQGKDDAAEKILEMQDRGDLKGKSAREIAEEIDWSRSHVQAVLEEYFEPVGASEGTSIDHGSMDGGRRLTISIPDDVENERDYLRGYVDGMQH